MDYRGKQVRIKDDVNCEGNGDVLAGRIGYIEGNWKEITGRSFLEAVDECNTAAMFAAKRMLHQYPLTVAQAHAKEDEKLVYVKIDGLGHIMLLDELEIIE